MTVSLGSTITNKPSPVGLTQEFVVPDEKWGVINSAGVETKPLAAMFCYK